MTEPHSILHNLRAAKCDNQWDSMVGSDSVRTCPICEEKVYRVEGLDDNQLLELVSTTQPAVDKTRLRFFRRPDGKLMVAPGRCSHLRRDAILGVLLFDGAFMCIPMFSSHSLGSYVLSTAFILSNMLSEATFKRLSKKSVMIIRACLAILIFCAFVGTLGYAGDISTVRIAYLVVIPFIIGFHAWIAARNAAEEKVQQVEKSGD
jgi:hypothetical protein